MVQTKCKNPNCTVAETGICLESHKNVQDCPNYLVEDDQVTEDVANTQNYLSDNNQASNYPVSTFPVRQFHAGNELGTLDAIPILRKRYTHLIGILGSSNAGKTCLLSSLYLLASQGMLIPDYLFAGSLTLKGFEERVRGLRAWDKGGLPNQLVAHTHLQDPRQPAFLHLSLREKSLNGKRLSRDLLLTDLPGEWTDNLIKNRTAASNLDFLKRADGIIYVIDGVLLNSIETKNVEVYRSNLAIDRLVENVLPDLRVPFIIAISKCDEIEMRMPEAVHAVKQHADERGLTTSVVLTIAISRKPQIHQSGEGVLQMIKSAIKTINNHKLKPFRQDSYERTFWRIEVP